MQVSDLCVDQILLRTMSGTSRGTGWMKRLISPQILAAVAGQWREPQLNNTIMSDDLLGPEAWVLPNLWAKPLIALLIASEIDFWRDNSHNTKQYVSRRTCMWNLLIYLHLLYIISALISCTGRKLTIYYMLFGSFGG